MRMGPVEADWKPYGFDNDGGMRRRTSLLSTMDTSSAAELRGPSEVGDSASLGYATSTAPHFGPPPLPAGAVQIPGCPIMVQTSPHIKVLVQVPEVDVHVHLARLYRFIYAYIGDVSLLVATMGLVDPQEVMEVRQHVEFARFVLERLEKYLLVPHLTLSLHLGLKMNQRLDQDDVVFSLDDVGSVHAVDLTGRFNVFDLFKDTCDALETFKSIYVDESIV
jgi:hypothetical protein